MILHLALVELSYTIYIKEVEDPKTLQDKELPWLDITGIMRREIFEILRIFWGILWQTFLNYSNICVKGILILFLFLLLLNENKLCYSKQK